MTPCTPGETNWRLVHPGNPIVKRFYDSYMDYMQRAALNFQGGSQVAGMGGAVMAPPALLQFARLGATQLPGGLGGGGLNGSGGLNGGLGGVTAETRPGQPSLNQDSQGIQPVTVDEPTSLGGDGLSSGFGRPIIGVVSKKEGADMFRNYYGIEKYNESLFFAGVNVIAAGFSNPYVLAAPVAPSAAKGPIDPDCPPPAMKRDGKCFGNLPKPNREPTPPPQ
jgi:hypothetical protein